MVQEGNLDLPDFEKHFSAAQKKVVEKQEDSASSGKKAISVLDPKKSNAIAIMMSKLPDLDEIVSAIEQLDDNKLSQENIEALIAQLPTQEDLSAIQAAKPTAETPLDKPEKFALSISSLSKVSERLQCWNFMKQFEEKKKDVFLPLSQIKIACYQLKGYEPLKAILGLALSCGNYLNGGTARGQADGFVISMLPKLADTKSIFDKNTSLLSYMVKHLYKMRPTLLAMGAEPKLQEAGKVSFAEVESGLRTLSGEVKVAKEKSLLVQAELKGKDKRFENIIVPFMEEAQRTLKHLEDLYQETCSLFLDLCIYFGWPEAKAKSITNDKFFGEMHLFMDEFIKLWKVEEAVEERKNFEKMMEKKQRLDAAVNVGKGNTKPGSKPTDNKGQPPQDSKPAAPAADLNAPSNPKSSLKKKFRNSAQQPLTPLPMGATSPPNESDYPTLATEPTRVTSPVPKESSTSSSTTNLRNKFRNKG